MKCAIIGAKGYIGRHLEYYLINQGHHVESYDIIECNNKNYTQCNLLDKESISRINLNVDYIFIFAGLTGTHIGFEKYEEYVNVNELGLLNLLNKIKETHFRPKIIYPSTRLIYKGQNKALCETDEKETRSIYAVNKLACEGYLEAYFRYYNIPYTVFRICVPFGNMLNNDYSFGTIGFFINQCKNNRKITLYGKGEYKRTFTSMHDLCYQIVEATFSPKSTGEIFNIGGITYSLYDAASYIAKHYNAEVSMIEWPEKDLKIESGSTFFDDTKIKSIIGNITYEGLNSLFF